MKPSIIQSRLTELRQYRGVLLPPQVRNGLADNWLREINERIEQIQELIQVRAVIINRIGAMIRDYRERGIFYDSKGQPITKGDVGFGPVFVDSRNRLYAHPIDDRERAIETGAALAVASKLYLIQETEIVFGSDPGDDVAGSFEGVSSGAGHQSAFHDLGIRTTASAGDFRFRCFNDAVPTPTPNQVASWYLKTSDGSHPDNDIGGDVGGDLPVASQTKLANLKRFASVVCDEAAAGVEFVASGMIAGVDTRYICATLWNALGSATSLATSNKCLLAPMPPESQ